MIDFCLLCCDEKFPLKKFQFLKLCHNVQKCLLLFMHKVEFSNFEQKIFKNLCPKCKFLGSKVKGYCKHSRKASILHEVKKILKVKSSK